MISEKKSLINNFELLDIIGSYIGDVMAGKTVTLNVRVDEYSNRVLGVVKERYGLRDKSEALNKILDMYGEEFVDKEVKEEVAKEVIRECEAMEKRGDKAMPLDEIGKLCGV